MPEYNIGFSEKLIEAAQVVNGQTLSSIDAQRTVLYLSLLSSEVSLKAFLESAGVPVQEIKAYSHNLRALLDAVCRCEVQAEVVTGSRMWVPASRVCAITVQINSGGSTVGTLLSLEQEQASRYPNEIRYGEAITHAPPAAMLQAAEKLHEWVKMHLGNARLENHAEPSTRDSFTEKSPRRRDTHTAVLSFCKAHGGGVQVGAEVRFDPSERSERGWDYWIGYEFVDTKGRKCGEVTAGYVAYIADIRLYASIILDEEVIESEARSLEKMSIHHRDKNEQPKELKTLIIDIAERATRKANARRGNVAI